MTGGAGRLLGILAGLVGAAAMAAAAGEEAASTTDDALPYAVNGDVSVGYRHVDVDGSDAKYREDYNLRTGARLFGLNVDGVARDAEQTHLDRFHLEIDTPGNEPVSTFRLDASDKGLYDLRVNFVRSKYYYAVPQLWQEPYARFLKLL